ncbi:hypothetical protein AWE51_04990 [Aquimarina aggregata]|uniref:HTH cro/C1-type domain-containing protein n=1 Tax=Aquimarina aggregata TaxID=1642818 RepID=A0A163A765_9FLAO|nr:helix-turn-helix domain-containing protein [Aquimarina aggregata]KZS40315.1 hypothetical protein AWE51_04990 [Aquimarina aggregata]
MPELIKYREKLNITQEELAEKSGISVRTIQRIEAGAKLKGHTLNAIAKALQISKEELIKEKSEETSNYKLMKLINISSLPFVVVPFLNIFVPVAIIYAKKEYNSLTKQIVSIQIMWTIISGFLFLLSPFFNRIFTSEIRLVLPVLIVSVLVNIIIILVNTIALDKNKKLRIKLKFSLI